MHRNARRTFVFVVIAAVLACSRDGRAATAPQQARAEGGGALFREAAAQAPAAAEAQVPVQASLAPLIDRLKPSVVNISTTTVMKHPRGQGVMPRGPRGQDPFEDFFERYFGSPAPEAPQEFRGQSLGSGFLLNAEGFILTNNHVVKDATDIQVMLSDGRQFTASVVGKDQLTDVALIKLKNPPKDLPTVMLGSSDVLRQGDFVLALGSPLGLRDTATLGIVSAKHRSGINPGGSGCRCPISPRTSPRRSGSRRTRRARSCRTSCRADRRRRAASRRATSSSRSTGSRWTRRAS